MPQNNIVLVLDATQRSALAVTRSIGSLSDSFVITTDSCELTIAGSSRYSDIYIQSPSAKYEPEAFIVWLRDVIVKHSINLLMPMTEVTSQLILMSQASLPEVSIPFATYEQVLQLADKSKLTKTAIELDIPVPQTSFFNNRDELEIDKLKYPCVLKPALSQIYKEGKWLGTEVRIVKSESELLSFMEKDAYLQFSPFMIQEFIPGHGAGVFCYYNKGVPKAFFAHSRLREKPPSGGVSVLSESVEVNEKLKQYAVSLLDSVNWHGVAMVEFRLDYHGKAYLMEVNTRFWGSLQLAIDSGVDFPRWVYSSEFGDKLNLKNIYKTGQRLRWLLGDLDSLYIFLKSRDNSFVEKIGRVFQFFVGNSFNCKHEVNRWNDIKPAITELKLYIRDLLGK